ncbi:MAG: hypothetical protein ABSF69_25645 [Polyangiaceae bacterium]|jgi:hypothetical protein
MMNSWWLVWMLCMFLFLIPSVGYGWGYRGWGPPYPSYVQRRRGLQAGQAGRPLAFDHEAWGWGGDFVWIVLLVGSLWAASALFLGWR